MDHPIHHAEATRDLIQFGIAQNGEIVGHANLLLSVSSGTLVLFDEFVKGRPRACP